MANFDELDGNMRALYEAAKSELVEIEAKRIMLMKRIEMLSPFYGNGACGCNEVVCDGAVASDCCSGVRIRRMKRAADVTHKDAPTPRRDRKDCLKEAQLREVVVSCLREVSPNSMAASEIFDRFAKMGAPQTNSFRTRVYSRLSAYVAEGILERVDRGAYRLKANDTVID